MSKPEQLDLHSAELSEVKETEEVVSKTRRPYQKPGFIVSKAFERQALSCAGCLNQASGWPSYCSNQSG